MTEDPRTEEIEEAGPSAPPAPDRPPLNRTEHHRVVAGVCGGLGRHLDIDPVVFRVVTVVLCLSGGLGLFLYGLAWLIVPTEPVADGKGGSRSGRTELQRVLTGRVDGQSVGAVLLTVIGTGVFFSSMGDGDQLFPLLLLLVLAVLGYVVTARRTEAPWARGFKYYLWLALTVVAIRVVFRCVFATGITPHDHLLFSLPHIPTPAWYAGIRIGGPVSLEATLSAAFDGLRLACLLCCIGAANTLANPKRALRVLPGALYELGVAVTVSLSVAPQLVQSVQRVTRARRLRAGQSKGVRALRSIVVPVLEDALERSLHLA
ncbi:PspC domain-containing protein, partial [Kitasatospora sp. NPDC001574]